MKVVKVRPARSVRSEASVYKAPSYLLAVDRQVEKFLDLKQKLIFFLITASVATIAYTLNFAVAHLDLISGFPTQLIVLVAGCVLGLLAAGSALYSLSQELASYRFHLDMRYRRKVYEQFPRRTREAWDRVKLRALLAQRAAFMLLFLSVICQTAFFLLIVI